MKTRYFNKKFLEKGFKRTFKTKVIKGSKIYYVFINFLIYLNRLFSTHFFDKIIYRLPSSSFVIKNSVGLFFVNSNDDTISHSTEYFESECQKWLKLPSIKKIFFDIGGNLGFYSILSSNLFDHVHCFEASSKMSNIIQKNRELNNASNIKIHNVAVSNVNKTLKFAENPLRTGLSHVMPSNGVEKNKNLKVTEVQAVNLDKFVELENINPGNIGMIKIDVEGHEQTILDGMENILKRLKTGSYLFIEILGGKNFKITSNFLKEFGFQIIEKESRNCLFIKEH